MTHVNQNSSGKLVLREKLRRRDLNEEEIRQYCWDQLYPQTKRFRQKRYIGCEPWQASSETFVQLTEHPEPNYLDWVRGTYTTCIPISDDQSKVIVPLTLCLDFTKEGGDCLRWTIDTRASQIHASAAYPGIHGGEFRILNLGSFNCGYEIILDTPIFSPYVDIESPYRGNDREEFRPITMKLGRSPLGGAALLESGHLENVFLGRHGYGCHVVVMQRVLRDIARLLVFGPRYEDMKLVPHYAYANRFENPGPADQRKADFFKSPHFPAAARLFSRVFCQGGLGDNEAEGDPVPPERCEASVQTIEALFENFNITREPPWLKIESEDWVDDMEAEAKALKTMADWRDFEIKWATVASYACGMNLHEGLWAGKNWQTYTFGST